MKRWLGVVALPEDNQRCCETLTKHCPTQVMGWCQQFQEKEKKNKTTEKEKHLIFIRHEPELTCAGAAEFIEEMQVGVLQNKTITSNYITRHEKNNESLLKIY